MLFDGERIAHGFVVSAPFAHESPSGTRVGCGVRHRDNGIDGGQEGKPRVLTVRVAGKRHNKVTAGGESHGADARSIDKELGSVGAEVIEGLFEVGEHVGILFSTSHNAVVGEESGKTCGTITEHESVDAVALEPLSHLSTLAIIVEPKIATPWANDHRGAIAVGGKEWGKGDAGTMTHRGVLP